MIKQLKLQEKHDNELPLQMYEGPGLRQRLSDLKSN